MSIEHDIPKRAVYLSENKKIAEAREKQFSKPWIKEPFTLVVAGDLMLTRPLSDVTRADVKEVIDLFKNSDCAITNLESNLVDIHNDPHVGGLQGSHELAGEVKRWALIWYVMPVTGPQTRGLMFACRSIICFERLGLWWPEPEQIWKMRGHRNFMTRLKAGWGLWQWFLILQDRRQGGHCRQVPECKWHPTGQITAAGFRE